ncbi:WRKY domain-containing protein [Chloropicon primus]|nr:WRKY domain-containing protein [Chloropicon primus]
MQQPSGEEEMKPKTVKEWGPPEAQEEERYEGSKEYKHTTACGTRTLYFLPSDWQSKKGGHRWRKYGEKTVLEASGAYSRSYFKCTTDKNCTLRKYCQVSEEDDCVMVTRYNGFCHVHAAENGDGTTVRIPAFEGLSLPEEEDRSSGATESEDADSLVKHRGVETAGTATSKPQEDGIERRGTKENGVVMISSGSSGSKGAEASAENQDVSTPAPAGSTLLEGISSVVTKENGVARGNKAPGPAASGGRRPERRGGTAEKQKTETVIDGVGRMDSHPSDWVNWSRGSGEKNAASDGLDFFIPTYSGDVSAASVPPQKVGTGGKKAFTALGAYPSLECKPQWEGGEDDKSVWMRVTNRLLGRYSSAKPKAGARPPTEEIHEFSESPLTTFVTEMMKSDVSIERAKELGVAQARERARVDRTRGCARCRYSSSGCLGCSEVKRQRYLERKAAQQSTSSSSTLQDSPRKRQRVSIK